MHIKREKCQPRFVGIAACTRSWVVRRPAKRQIISPETKDKILLTHLLRNLFRPHRQVLRQAEHSAAVLERRDEIRKLITCSANLNALLHQDIVHALIANLAQQDVQVHLAGADLDPDPDI